MEQAPIKDPESQHPIATAWRPTFREIVRRFVSGDFTLEGMPSVEPVPAKTADQIRAYIADYGEALIELPEETWETSVAQWSEEYWQVLVDLWTAESGRSDMVIDARVTETNDGFRYGVQLVYVP